ncbi:MAG: hypothetical protein ABIF88_00275 [archaeon]
MSGEGDFVVCSYHLEGDCPHSKYVKWGDETLTVAGGIVREVGGKYICKPQGPEELVKGLDECNLLERAVTELKILRVLKRTSVQSMRGITE